MNVSAGHTYPGKKGTPFEGQLVEERSTEELVQEYDGWEDEVKQLLQVR